MAIKLISSKKAAVNNGVKILTYSKAGFGKTMLCVTAPSPILISAESGLLSLREANIKKVFGNKKHIHTNLPVIEIKNIKDLEDCYQWVTESKEAKEFETICLDSISEIAEVVLNNAKKDSKDPRQAYGVLIEQMSGTIRAFRDLPKKNVYMTAKQEFSTDEHGVRSYVPSLPGAKLSQQIPYFFDEVFNLNIGTKEDGSEYRYLRTQPTIQYEAKDRSGMLDAIERPDLTHIFNKITGAK